MEAYISRPVILDLFCGAGGAALGLSRAGFKVIGVDNKPMPRYPFYFIQADALTCSLDGFDAYWASPPCQGYSVANNAWKYEYPKLIEPIRERLIATKKPYIIENVCGAPLRDPIMLCGLFFGLMVPRHRIFESNYLLPAPPHFSHLGFIKYGAGADTQHSRADIQSRTSYIALAMGITWMRGDELAEAIPPAYSEFLGKQLIKYCI